MINVDFSQYRNKYLPEAQKTEVTRNLGLAATGITVGLAGVIAACGMPLTAVISMLALAVISAVGTGYAQYVLNDSEFQLALFIERLSRICPSLQQYLTGQADTHKRGGAVSVISLPGEKDVINEAADFLLGTINLNFLVYALKMSQDDIEMFPGVLNHTDKIIEKWTPFLAKIERGFTGEDDNELDAFEKQLYDLVKENPQLAEPIESKGRLKPIWMA